MLLIDTLIQWHPALEMCIGAHTGKRYFMVAKERRTFYLFDGGVKSKLNFQHAFKAFVSVSSTQCTVDNFDWIYGFTDSEYALVFDRKMQKISFGKAIHVISMLISENELLGQMGSFVKSEEQALEFLKTWYRQNQSEVYAF